MENPNLSRYNIVDLILNEIQNEIQTEIQNEGTESGETGNCPASKEFIDSLDLMEITEEEKTCSICLEEFTLGEKCFKLPCKDHPHFFHGEKENCMGIKKWLQKSNTCPVCRTEFPKENESGNRPAMNEPVGEPPGEERIRQIDESLRNLMGNILNSNIRILNPQDIIEMEEQRQLDAAIQASLEEQ